ncbi:MAG: response regulator [Planctomycetes bacterium]|nr:response regulator [Planctomycetota bacterium]
MVFFRIQSGKRRVLTIAIATAGLVLVGVGAVLSSPLLVLLLSCIGASVIYFFGRLFFIGCESKSSPQVENDWAESMTTRLGSILENSLNEIYIFDRESLYFIQVNKGGRQNTGYSMEELRCMTPLDIKPEFNAESFTKLISPLIDGEQDEIEFRTVHRRKDGSDYPVEVHLQISEEGDSEVFAAIILDVTEREKAEERIRNSKEQAEAGTKAKSEFLANISHELRTPMNSIIGFSEILREDGLEGAHGDYIKAIHVAGITLMGIIDDIFDLSSIENGKLEIKIEECSLGDCLEVINSLMRPEAMHKGLKFEILQCGVLPEMIPTDAVRLHQCLVHLVNNAIKFTDEGHVFVNVSMVNEGTGCFVRFDVEDTGIGVAADSYEAILESFTQADGSATRKYGGTGLGLSITSCLAGLLGGSLSLKSKEGGGSIFSLMIPVNFDSGISSMLDRYEYVNRAFEEDEFVGEGRFNGRVLIVDDCRANQERMRLVLEERGIDVVLASDGKECIEKASSEEFDLIFMDIHMPVMNGYEAVKKLRDQCISTPIVAFTAYEMRGDKEKCLAMGCDSYITKPFDESRLLLVLESFICCDPEHAAGR